jgi:hypothetical protein
MAVIRIEAQSNRPLKYCDGRKEPVIIGRFIEFRDATEEELAFWDVLDDAEKKDVITEAYSRCFFEVLNEMMQNEAMKGKKMQEKESSYSTVQRPGPPPNSPPTPQGPNQPLSCEIGLTSRLCSEVCFFMHRMEIRDRERSKKSLVHKWIKIM